LLAKGSPVSVTASLTFSYDEKQIVLFAYSVFIQIITENSMLDKAKK